MTRSRVVAVAALAVLTLALSGCVRMGVEVGLKTDGTASSSVVLAVEDRFLEQTGQSPDSVIDALTQGQDDPEANAVRTEEFQRDGYTGTRYVYPEAEVGDVGDQVGWPINVVREGDDYLVSGTLDLTEEALGRRGGASTDNLSVTVDLTFPGPVEESNGIVDGNTVRWEPPVGESVEISARGSAVGPADQDDGVAAGGSEVVTLPVVPEWVVLVLGLSGLVILLLIGIIVWQAMLRVRDRRPEVPAGAPFPQHQVPRPAPTRPVPPPYGGAPQRGGPPVRYGAPPVHPQEQVTPQDPTRPPSFPPGF